MAWSVPLTAVSNATLTAAQWNASVRDNLLETAPAKATAAGRLMVTTGANAIAERVPTTQTIATAQTTLSTSYVDLTTVGPSVTVTTGTAAIIILTARINVNTASIQGNMGYAVSGASTIAASDNRCLRAETAGTGEFNRSSMVTMDTTLTAGSNTFTAKYHSGNASATVEFADREILVIPL